MNEEMIYRSIDIKDVKEDSREFSGLFAPYDEVITNSLGFKERYAPGVFKDARIGVPVYYQHDHRVGGTPIGQVTGYEDTPKGAVVHAKLSKTAKADEIYELLRDSTVTSLSAGFNSLEERADGDVTVYTKGYLGEVSVTPYGAFPSAKISSVRAKEPIKERDITKEEVVSKVNKMSEVTLDDISEIRSSQEAFGRDLEIIKNKVSENAAPATTEFKFRSGGELLFGIRNNDADALKEVRAYTGAALSDSQIRPGWVNQGLKLIDSERKVVNLFSHAPLQSDGMSFVIPTVASTTGAVGVQAAEGDLLPYSELVLGNQTVTIETLGGYIEVSKQVRERSSVDYINTALDLLAKNYAKKTNSEVVNGLVNAVGVNTGTAITLSSSTYASWKKFVEEGSVAIEDNANLDAEFMLVSRDVFNVLTGFLDTTGRPMMELNNDGTNTIGSGSIVKRNATFLGMPVVSDGSLPAKTAFIGNSTAVTVYESAGAPYDLADQDITRLTEQYSLYGYLAVAATRPKGLFKVAVS